MWDDLRFAVRRLRHSPGFTIVSVLTLAVAVGANTAILSIADGVLFRPLPYDDADRVFVIQMMDRATGSQYTRVDLRYLDLVDARGIGVSRVAMAESAAPIRIASPDGVEAVPATAVTPNYFEVLGVRAARGRLFGVDDAREPGRAAVLSHASWRSRFGAAEDIVGQPVTLGDRTFHVIGVLPANFVFPAGTFFVGNPEIVTVMPRPTPGTDDGTFHPVVRLDPGVTPDQAQAALFAAGAEMNRTNPGLESTAPFLNDVRSILYPTGRPVMRFMLAAAVLVLLLGCANLANMLLARGRRLERETAMRAALGASAVRIVRPVILEALLVGAAASALAVGVTAVGFDALRRQVPASVYGSTPVGVDTRVMLVGLALGVAAALLFAAVPVWRAQRLDVQTVMHGRQRQRGGRAARAGRPMVVAQVALAIVLVFGAVIAARAFVAVLNTPLGFDPSGVLTIAAPEPPAGEDRLRFHRRVLDAVAARGDVVSAGGSGSLPLGGSAPYSAALRPGTGERAGGVVQVLPGYFETVGIPLRRGRLLNWDDAVDRTAAVVSESAARALFGDDDPLGRQFGNGRDATWTVVGVVPDVRASLTSEYPPTAYALPGDRGRMVFVIRTRGRGAPLVSDLEGAIAEAAGGTRVRAIWWSDTISRLTAISNPRFQTVVLASFAGIALGLTALGIFGVVAVLVVSRSKELGIRVAIGANPESLVRLVVRQALLPVGAGLVLGLAATRVLAGFAESQLYDVETRDPLTLAAAAATVVAASLVAAYVPARRASRVDPLVVLKAE
jgi:predicted permease